MGTVAYSKMVDATGAATITVLTRSPVPWIVSQVSTEMSNTPAGALCNIRKNGAIITPMIPNGDVASGEPYILLNDTDNLTIEWSACTAGEVGKATVLYADKV